MYNAQYAYIKILNYFEVLNKKYNSLETYATHTVVSY